jgi:hypothetical protein
MKLKTNKTFTKRPIPKMRNQKNMDWSWNTNNLEYLRGSTIAQGYPYSSTKYAIIFSIAYSLVPPMHCSSISLKKPNKIEWMKAHNTPLPF